MDRGTWWAAVHGAAESPTQLSIHTITKTCLKHRECIRLCIEGEFTGRENCSTWNHTFFDFCLFNFSCPWCFGSRLHPELLSLLLVIVVVRSLSRVQLLAPPWTAARQASLSFTVLRFAQTHVHLIRDAIQLSHPLPPLLLPPAFSLTLRCYSRADFTLEVCMCKPNSINL